MTRALVIPLAVALAACGPSSKERRGAEIHHDLAVEALRSGHAIEALREYDEALKRNERFPEAHLGRGLVLELGFGRNEDAEREYRRALALRADYPEAHNNLGQLLARTGRYSEALGQFDAALEDLNYREPYIARCNRGVTLARMGRKEEGLSELRACIATAPAYCSGHRELGRALLQDNRLKEALDVFVTYARVCERQGDAHLQLGLVRMRVGDIAGARASFERCRDLAGETAEGVECRKSLSLLE
jgi:type IV pilus biogenesis/stability protein PilW